MRPTIPLLRLMTTWLLATLVVGIPTHPLLAATYYVDAASGDDARAASDAANPDTPWQSLTRALGDAALAPGDVVRLAAGAYQDGSIGGGGAALEAFPLPLLDGVAVMGAGAETVLTSGAGEAVFEASGELGAATWLGELTLQSSGGGVGLRFDPGGGSQEPTLDSLIFGASLSDGVVVDLGPQGGRFAPRIADSDLLNAGDGLALEAVGADLGDAAFCPLVTGSAFANGGHGISVVFGDTPARFEVCPEVVGNTFYPGQRRSAVRILGYAAWADHHLAPLVEGNTISGAGGGLSLQLDRYSPLGDLSSARSNSSGGAGSAPGQRSSALEPGIVVAASVTGNRFVTQDAPLSVRLEGPTGAATTFDLTFSGNELAVSGADGVAILVVGADGADTRVTLDASHNTGGLESLRPTTGDLVSFIRSDYETGGDVSATLRVTDNTLQPVRSGVNARIDLYSSWRPLATALSVELRDNALSGVGVGEGIGIRHDGGFGSGLPPGFERLDVDLLASGNTFQGLEAGVVFATEHQLPGSLSLAADLHDNLFSALSEGAVSLRLSEAEGPLDLDAALDVSRNQVVGGGEIGVDLTLVSAASADARIDLNVLENVMEDVEDGAAIQIGHLSDGSQVDLSAQIEGNDLTVGRGGLRFEAFNLQGAAWASQVEIADNRLSGAGGPGIYLSLEDLEDSAVQHATRIGGNEISQCEEGIQGRHANVVGGSEALALDILSNEVSGSRYAGIRWSESTLVSGEAASDVLVAGNTIRDAGADGLVFHASSIHTSYDYQGLWTLSNNRIADAAGRGIELYLGSGDGTTGRHGDVVIAGNTVTGAGEEGIFGSVWISEGAAAPNPPGQVLISGNVADGNEGSGVELWIDDLWHPGVDLALVDNLAVRSGRDGMEIATSRGVISERVLVEGNTITGNQHHGLHALTLTTRSSGIAVDAGGGALGSAGLNTLMGNGGAQLYAGIDSDEPWRAAPGVTQACPTMSARHNHWGTVSEEGIADAIQDCADPHGGSLTVDASLPLEEAPRVAAWAVLVADPAGPGAEGDALIALRATLAGAGDIGCAAATFHADIPPGAALVAGSLWTSKGAPLATAGVDVGLQWLAAQETVTVGWQLSVPQGGCVDAGIQGRLVCQQLGAVPTDDPAAPGQADPTRITAGAALFHADLDGDGYGDPAAPELACAAPAGAVANDQDCDDADASVNPGAAEVCDEADDDCDGQVDEDPLCAEETPPDGGPGGGCDRPGDGGAAWLPLLLLGIAARRRRG